MDLVIVDTDILIDLGAAVPEAVKTHKLLGAKRTLGISAVTKMELLVGCANKREQQRLEKFLASFELVHPVVGISEIAIDLVRQYRLSHNMKLADAMIAASALYCDCELASKNQKDYRYIPALKLLPYPVLKL